MSYDKKLIKFLNNPENTRYKDIEQLLISIGFEKIYAKGSHLKFKHKNLINDLVIPVHNNDCKPFYKRLTAKIIKELTYYENG